MIDVAKPSFHRGNVKISFGYGLASSCRKRTFSNKMLEHGFTRVEIDDLMPEMERRHQRGHTINSIVAELTAEKNA